MVWVSLVFQNYNRNAWAELMGVKGKHEHRH